MAEEDRSRDHAADSVADSVYCPVCLKEFKTSTINRHLDACLAGGGAESSPMDPADHSAPPGKKARTSASSSSSPMFAMFQSNKHKPGNQASKGTKRGLVEDFDQENKVDDTSEIPGQSDSNLCPDLARRTLFSIDKPLAEILRPKSLEEYFGQNKVVGEHTLLRSLLDTQEIPSLILWGPPGCGKTTLAHIIACSCKKKGTFRFITLSATSASVNDVREVIKQANNELRLCKRRTILFIDEIHRFNKSQQDTFLPHVENGTVTLIGATTENPSFQVNAALLSRCRVLVLERLSVEAMSSILLRAVDTLGVRVLGPSSDGLKPPVETVGQQPVICIEQHALDTIAHLCDGDARTGLNSLQLSIQAQVSLAQSKALQGGSNVEIVVTEVHVKEGLQRSHILYDKAGEEHYNCISALHKSMRGSHQNASLYWLGRMLEGGEDPLYVARRLVRFASEDVGMADPLALPQAVSAFQACHFIGMPECEVILAQCVVYLAQAPKSVDVYKAYNNVKACLRNHKGPLPLVPLHLRNAPTKLMKQLGYAKGYKYNPAFSEPVEQDYLPQELKDMDFFSWTPSK
ncbi:unnamed protein product [Knipowitschia caucasica]|uniref:UBZ4-type domain-containing protein n=1 Tax=Knipowitschia caucasica TaxID=637954 RepID=A0AAV2JPA3_KNICA